MYALLLAIIYIAFISLGLPDSLIGAGWPVMQRDLDVPIAFMGFVTVIIAGGTIVSSLASERLTRRWGAGLVTAVSVGMTAAAMLGFASSGSFWMLCLWAIPYGLGAGAVDAALHNYVALHFAARHMNWLHACWGLGASISPFIMSSTLSAGMPWNSAYLIVGIIQAVLTFALFASLPLWGRNRTTVPLASGDSSQADAPEPAPAHKTPHVPLMTALRIPGVPYVLTAFFAYCAFEATAILWASTYFVTDRGVEPSLAAAFAAMYVLGITVGRFLAGFVADRVGDRMLIRGGFIMAGVGVVMIALPFGGSAFALVGLVIAGLGSAPIYPAIIHSTPTNFGRENSQAIIGIQMASAYVGSTLAPPTFGFLAEVTGTWIFPLFLGVLVVLGLVMSERLARR